MLVAKGTYYFESDQAYEIFHKMILEEWNKKRKKNYHVELQSGRMNIKEVMEDITEKKKRYFIEQIREDGWRIQVVWNPLLHEPIEKYKERSDLFIVTEYEVDEK